MLRFKTEISLLLASIVLFTLSAFFFSYAAGALSFSYPLRNLAIPLVSSGGALMTVASVSYSKRSKKCD